jgi:hypothetical protein
LSDLFSVGFSLNVSAVLIRVLVKYILKLFAFALLPEKKSTIGKKTKYAAPLLESIITFSDSLTFRFDFGVPEHLGLQHHYSGYMPVTACNNQYKVYYAIVVHVLNCAFKFAEPGENAGLGSITLRYIDNVYLAQPLYYSTEFLSTSAS